MPSGSQFRRPTSGASSQAPSRSGQWFSADFM
jgi:hypothetical protein